MNEIEELNIYTNSRCAWSNINFSLSLSFSPLQYTLNGRFYYKEQKGV